MKSAVIYSALTQLTPMHRILQPTMPIPGNAATFQPGHGPAVYVRMEVKEGMGVLDALDAAEPMPGEIVLNSIPLEGREIIGEIIDVEVTNTGTSSKSLLLLGHAYLKE